MLTRRWIRFLGNFPDGISDVDFYMVNVKIMIMYVRFNIDNVKTHILKVS